MLERMTGMAWQVAGWHGSLSGATLLTAQKHVGKTLLFPAHLAVSSTAHAQQPQFYPKCMSVTGPKFSARQRLPIKVVRLTLACLVLMHIAMAALYTSTSAMPPATASSNTAKALFACPAFCQAAMLLVTVNLLSGCPAFLLACIGKVLISIPACSGCSHGQNSH